MVKIISQSEEDTKISELFQILETVTLEKFPSAVIEPQGIGTRYYSKDKNERFIYPRGRSNISQMGDEEIVVRLGPGPPQLSINRIGAYEDALKLAKAYEDTTNLKFYLHIP